MRSRSLTQAIAESGSVPTVAELLASIASALDLRAPICGGDDAGPFLVGLEPPGIRSTDADPVQALVHALVAAFERAAGSYRESWGREPRDIELARTVLFVVAPATGAFVQPDPRLDLAVLTVRRQ